MKTCPTCGALPQEPCHDRLGAVLGVPHERRSETFGWQAIYDAKWRYGLRFRLGGNG